MDPQPAKSDQAASPTRSDKSSDSEGRPVREKLKETRIDAQGPSEPVVSLDKPMEDAPTNGVHCDISTSGSESERGRLRRKRSREDFEDGAEMDKHPEKKHERHVRKKSRDVTSPVSSDAEISAKKANGAASFNANSGKDEAMSSVVLAADRQSTPEVADSNTDANTVTSPKNKRKLEDAAAGIDTTVEPLKDSDSYTKAEERDTKRPRDTSESEPSLQAIETKSKIHPGSGFSNISSTSPFATIPPKSPSGSSQTPDNDMPRTSDTAFKKSGFGAFASVSASPFATSHISTKSPFAAATKPASSTSTSSGFSGFGGASSSFGGSSALGKTMFGGALGTSAFGNLTGGKPTLSTFGGGGTITGLKSTAVTAFGAAETKEASDDEDGDDDDDKRQGDDEGDDSTDRKTNQAVLQANGPPETGEENENAYWTGRGKLYTLGDKDGRKEWVERGVGPLKVNKTKDTPTRARFVLRADGTHRLLLNAAITSNMRIGDVSGKEPKDGKLLFATPTATGEVESHILKLRPERAAELWKKIKELQQIL